MEWSAKHNGYVAAGSPPTHGPRPHDANLISRVLLFVAAFAILQSTWQALRESPVERAVIHHATVRPAAFLVNAITPEVNARAVDFRVTAPGGGINVLNGCEGLEALFLLAAAFAVAPLSIKSRLFGFLLGVPVVFAINQARILALFYAHRHDPALFYPLHATVAPIVVVIVVALYFYLWLYFDGRRIAQAA